MRIAATGFVSSQAGSVASANALLLRGLLERGYEVEFFSKASFVDPRPAVGSHPNFCFTDVDNRWADRVRAKLEHIPIVGRAASILDSLTYNRLLVRSIAAAHSQNPFDLVFWLGDYAFGSVPGIPSVSFAQGPPGTDARSLISRFSEIKKLAGIVTAWKLRLMAQFRLSKFGLPRFQHSDCIIVGSEQSKETLEHRYGIDSKRLRVLPYPIDLNQFQLPNSPLSSCASLRCLWVGRIVPRKRLDLFLKAGALAIQAGTDLHLSIIGSGGFVPGYDRLIQEFPFPERLRWEPFVAREKIPEIMHLHDVLIQPSEEENFGSSVAEAQACGLPVIIGRTNGNADYLCSRDLRLSDERAETLAAALRELANRKQLVGSGDPQESRLCAVTNFSPDIVVNRLAEMLREIVSTGKAS